MSQQSAQQRSKVAAVSSSCSATTADALPLKPDSSPYAKALSTKKPGISATALRGGANQIKKLAFRLSPKLRKRLRPGLPPTAIHRQAPASTQVSAAKLMTIAAGIQHESIAGDSSRSIAVTPGLTPTPYKDLKGAIVGMPVGAESRSPGNALKLQGDYWEVTYEGKTSILEDTRGLQYIALLIRQAGQGPIYASELVACATGNAPATVELEVKQPIIDSAAENRVIKRLEDIGFERTSAAAQNNYDRVAALDEEVDRITEELQKLRAPQGGRGTFNNSAEKARKAVSKALSEAISKMLSHPDLEPLANHLSTSIQKGQWLSYNGDARWDVKFQMPAVEKSRSRPSSVATRKVAAAKAGNSK